MKHTKGPWYVGYASREKIETSTLAVWQKDVLDSGYGSVICKVSPEITMNEEDKANAQLIAACPTMYEYILKKAEAGDEEAAQIIKSIGYAKSNF